MSSSIELFKVSAVAASASSGSLSCGGDCGAAAARWTRAILLSVTAPASTNGGVVATDSCRVLARLPSSTGRRHRPRLLTAVEGGPRFLRHREAAARTAFPVRSGSSGALRRADVREIDERDYPAGAGRGLRRRGHCVVRLLHHRVTGAADWRYGRWPWNRWQPC